MKAYFVYITSNKPYGVLYTGVTSNLTQRVFAHKNKFVDSFSKKYNTDKLVYYEETSDVYSAITREKQIKKWNRAWKIRLIEEKNPSWKDLYEDII